MSTQQPLQAMPAHMNQVCSGYCVPLYLYGGIAGLGILANFFFNQKLNFGGRVWSLFTSTLWALVFGLIIFMLCRSCQYQYAYIALIVPSILFGISMLLLLLQNRRAAKTVVVAEK